MKYAVGPDAQVARARSLLQISNSFLTDYPKLELPTSGPPARLGNAQCGEFTSRAARVKMC